MALETHTLDNGLLVLLDSHPVAPVISFNALVKVGSAFETDDEAGICHVIEHMLFKGTPTRPVGQIAREVEAAGGEINAYTSFDQTVYYINMASRFADRGLEILADAVTHPLFDATELAREQEVILEEVRREHDHPSRMVNEYLFQTAYQRHPYRRPIIGYPQTITAFTQKSLRAFYRRWYTPHNMVFIVVGDFESTAMLEKIRRAFDSFRGPPPPLPPGVELQELAQRKPRSFIKPMSVQSTQFAIGYHIPEITHEDVPALDVLSHILGGGEASRLELTVKEKKHLVHRIGAYAYTPRFPGLFTINGACTESKTSLALNAVREEVERLKTEPVSQAEIARATLNIRASEVYERETVGGQAGKIAHIISSAGTMAFEARYYRALSVADADAVMRVAQRYLVANNCTACFVTPQGARKKQKPSQLQRAIAGKETRAARRAPRARGCTPELLRLANGLTLVVQENHHLPLVSIVAAAIGGTRFETRATNGVSALVANSMTKGTASRSASRIAHDIEALAGSVEGFSGRNAIGLRAECVSDRLREGFALFADVFTHPAFAPEEVEKERQLLLQAIRDQEDALGSLAFLHFLKNLYPQHPYGLNGLGSATSVAHLTPKHLVCFWNETVRASGTVLSVVGDVRRQEVEELARELLTDLATGKPLHPRIARDARPTTIRTSEVMKQGKEQAHIVLGFQGPTYADADHYAMIVLNNILAGQGGRLFLSLRDRESLAYAVSSVLQAGIDPGHFAVYIGTEPGKVDTAIAGIKRELAAVRKTLVTKAELERAQQYLVGTYELDLQRNSSLATSHAFNIIYHLGLEEIERYPQKILAVTAKEIQRVAQKFIDLDAYVLAIVRPK